MTGSNTMMKKENYFVGIGAPRSGTTWLANYFLNHPQVCFSPIKELHYFDAVYRSDLCGYFNKDFISRQKALLSTNNSDANTEQYLRCITRRIEMIRDENVYKQYLEELVKDEVTFGEITPAYILLERNGYRAINKMYPRAKYIIILRNPVDRYWSNLKYFERLNDKYELRTSETFAENLSNPKLYLRSDYKRALTELFSVVPRENVIVLFYENLFDSASGFECIKRITDFLAIDYLQANFLEVINPTCQKNMDAEMRIIAIKKFKSIFEYICEHYAGQVPKSWLDDISRL